MSAKYRSPSFLLPNELNTSANPLNTDGDPATGTGINSLYSMNFDGTNNIDCGNISALNGATQATWSCWYRKTANASPYFMGTWGDVANTKQFIAYQYNTGMAVYMGKNTSGSNASHTMFQNLSFGINVNTWYHMAFVFDASESSNADKLKFYLNGTPITNTVAGGALTSLNSVTSSFDIGGPTTLQKFTGNLDEVAIFNRALDSTERAALYDGTGSNIRPSNLMATNLNPVAYYPLGEQAQNSGYPSATGNEWQFPNGVLQDYVMDFNIAEQSVDIANDFHNYTEMSVSVWVNFNNFSGYQYVFSAGDASAGVAGSVFAIAAITSTGEIYSWDGLNLNNTGISVILNTWNNVLVTQTGTTRTVFINGQQAGNSFTTSALNLSQGTAFIGKYLAAGFSANAKISNVAIWNSDQSTNIADIYNNGSPQTSYTVSPQNWWKLNADSVYNLGIGLDGFDGTNNTGGGGGGGGSQYLSGSFYVGDGGKGGSGVVVLKYPTILNLTFSNGLIKSDVISGNNTITSIKSGTGTVTFGNAGTISDYLVIAGGGGGGGALSQTRGEAGGGGGGGGGLLTGTSLSVSAQSYNITIGEGGAGGLKTTGNTIGNQGENGQDSIFSTFTAVGGGGGGAGQVGANALSAGKNGGSGGGPGGSSGALTSAGGTGSQGSNGGGASAYRAGGGGGGYSLAGTTATSNSVPGDGGNGYLSTLTNTYYSGGGGGGVWYISGSIPSGGSAGSGSTGTGGTVSQQGNITPEGPNFSNWWKIPSALPITTTPNYTTALDFNGTSNKITSISNSGFTSNAARTFSAWIKTTDTGNYVTVIQTGPDSTNNNFELGTFGGFLHFSSWATYNFTGNVTISDGNWHFVCITFDGSVINGYVDGNSAGPNLTNASASLATTDTPYYIGGSATGNSAKYFDGSISNVAVYNSALTSSQVSTLFNFGTPETAISFSPISWWKLDNLTTGIQDSGSASNNGTNSNPGATQVTSDVLDVQPVNGVSTTLPSTALQQSDLQFDSPYSNYSLFFDGTIYIDCSNSSILNIFNNISISAWVKASTFANYDLIIGRSTNNDYDLGISGGGGSGVLRFHSGNGTTQEYVDSAGFSLALNQWYHVAIVRTVTPNQVTFFVNGQQLNTAALSLTPTGSTDITRIGSRSGTFGFNGKIDETALWSTALTSAQILEIYNNGRPKDLTTFSGTAPISWWRLGENAYFVNNNITLPNSVSGTPNGVSSGTATSMLSADAPGTYANGIGTNLDIIDRVGEAALSTSNSQSYNMIPSDISPYVPKYVGTTIANAAFMTFDGNDEYFNTGSSTIGQLQVMSVSAWFKETQNAVANTALVANNGSTDKGWIIWIDGTNMRWQVADGSNTSWNNTIVGSFRTYAPLGNWNHVCCTFDGVDSKIYINGILRETWTATPTPYVVDYSGNVGNLTIGRRSYANSGFFRGQIDEVALFNYALTADQVKFDIYEPTKSGTGLTANLDNNPNLTAPVAWYRMGD